MGYSIYAQRKMLQGLLQSTPCYLAAFNSSGVEVTQPGYSRKLISFQLFNTTPIALKNSAQLSFGPTPSNWGVVTHVAVFDALTGGNILTTLEPLDAPKNMAAGGVLPFTAYALEFRV